MTRIIELQKRLEAVCKILIYFVFAMSFGMLICIAFSPSLLQIICWHTTSITGISALAYFLTSIAYILGTAKKGKRIKFIISRLITVLLIGLGSTVLILQVTGQSVPFLAQIVNKNILLTNTIKTPPIATCFIIYGLAIWLLNYETKRKRMLSQFLVIPTTILGAYLALCFLFNSGILVNASTHVPLSIYSAIFNLMISFAIFFANADKGLAGEITKTRTGSKTIFNLLPVVIIVPVVIGLIHLFYIPASTPFGLAFLILLFILFCFGIVYFNLTIINKDLFERQRVQSALEDSMQNVLHLSNLIERSTDAIIFIDENYIIKQWNKGAEKVYGFSAEEVIGKNKFELLDTPYFTLEQFNKGVAELIANGGERTSTRLQNSKSGKTLTVLQSAVATKVDNGKLTGFFGIGKDITDLVEKEKELVRLNNILDGHLESKTSELNSVYERISDAVICLNNNWCYTYHNKMAFNLTKETAHISSSMIGKNIWEEFPILIGTTLYDAYHVAMKEQVSNRIEYYYKEYDMWTEQTIYPTTDGLSVFLRDITEKKLAEIKQKDAEEKYRTIVETSQEGILIRDTKGVITYVNDYLTTMLKESREYLIGLPLLSLFTEENLKIMQINMERRNQGFTDTYDLTLPLRNGSLITVYIKSTPYHEKGVFAGSLSTITDITDIKNKELELKKLSGDLRSLSAYLQDIREEERKKIAMEIHDELGQNLAILKMDATWISKQIAPDNLKLYERLVQFNKITDDTVKTSRRLYNHLYPQMLYDIGLIGTINWHAESYIKPGNINFIINTNLSETIYPEYHNLWLALYRVYQECITNIIRYAEATTVVVDLYMNDDKISMDIKDNGKGFEVDNVDTKLHHGLLGMRERVYSISGNIKIDSDINKGTKVNVCVPIPTLVNAKNN